MQHDGNTMAANLRPIEDSLDPATHTSCHFGLRSQGTTRSGLKGHRRPGESLLGYLSSREPAKACQAKVLRVFSHSKLKEVTRRGGCLPTRFGQRLERLSRGEIAPRAGMKIGHAVN